MREGYPRPICPDEVLVGLPQSLRFEFGAGELDLVDNPFLYPKFRTFKRCGGCRFVAEHEMSATTSRLRRVLDRVSGPSHNL